MRYVVMVIVCTGCGLDLESYPEEYTGIEWCNLRNARQKLKEAQKIYPDAYIDEREVMK